MRLSLNLEEELYAIARSYAREHDCSISAAVNVLLRRSLEPKRHRGNTPQSGLPVVRGRRPLSSEDVYRLDIDNEP